MAEYPTKEHPHPPGRLGRCDFIATGHLGVTIAGVPPLPYSGFEYAEVVLGDDSFVALSGGCQNALWRAAAAEVETADQTAAAPPAPLRPHGHGDCEPPPTSAM